MAGKSRFIRFLIFLGLKPLKCKEVKNVGVLVFKFSHFFLRKNVSLSCFSS